VHNLWSAGQDNCSTLFLCTTCALQVRTCLPADTSLSLHIACVANSKAARIQDASSLRVAQELRPPGQNKRLHAISCPKAATWLQSGMLGLPCCRSQASKIPTRSCASTAHALKRGNTEHRSQGKRAREAVTGTECLVAHFARSSVASLGPACPLLVPCGNLGAALRGRFPLSSLAVAVAIPALMAKLSRTLLKF
jgi:hypothetical protein